MTELTLENAGDLVSRAGVTVRAKAECQRKFTELLLSMGAGLQRKEVVEKAKVERKDGSGGNGSGSGSGSGNGGTTPTPGGDGDEG